MCFINSLTEPDPAFYAHFLTKEDELRRLQGLLDDNEKNIELRLNWNRFISLRIERTKREISALSHSPEVMSRIRDERYPAVEVRTLPIGSIEIFEV